MEMVFFERGVRAEIAAPCRTDKYRCGEAAQLRTFFSTVWESGTGQSANQRLALQLRAEETTTLFRPEPAMDVGHSDLQLHM
jgi:hypothetical protein